MYKVWFTSKRQKTAEMRDEILNEIKKNSPFSVLIPIFIKNTNTCVDHIYEDLQTTLRNIDKKIVIIYNEISKKKYLPKSLNKKDKQKQKKSIRKS